MLLILLNWIFIFITCLGTGYFLFRIIRFLLRETGEQVTLSLVIITGLFAVTVIASFVNFILPLNAICRYSLFIVSCIIILFYRKPVGDLIANAFEGWRELKVLSRLILGAVFIIAWIKSAGPSELIDEGGYFLPYIRWMEEYHLIPGLANIEDRMGFNSSFHTLCALFSMREWYPDGLYDVNGFILVICSSFFITGPNRLLNKNVNFLLSDYVKTFCLFFLLRNMLTSSPADLSNVFFAELACILFIEKVERQNLQDTDAAFIVLYLLTILLVTIKFSSAAMLLLPVSLLFFNKRQILRNFLFFSLLSTVVFSAWLIRSYFLSGYLIFPMYTLDLFDPLWKVPEAMARNQYLYVQQFARLNVERIDSEWTAAAYSFTEWVPMWFNLLNIFNKITTVALGITLLVSFYYLIFRRMLSRGYLVLYFVLLVNIVLWFIKFPAYRFGWAFIIVFIALISTFVAYHSGYLKQFRIITLIFLGAFIIQSTVKTFSENIAYFSATAIYPVSEPEPKYVFKKLGDVPAVISEIPQCWGIDPPCLPSNYNPKLKAIGPRVTDGFYISEN